MNLKLITMPIIMSEAKRIMDLAEHGTFIDGIACSLFRSIHDSAQAIIKEVGIIEKTQPNDEVTK